MRDQADSHQSPGSCRSAVVKIWGEHHESKLLREVEHAHALLDELEAIAGAQRAHAAIVTINAARDLADHIVKLRATPRGASGFASLKVSRDIESARRQLNLWITRLSGTLRGSTPPSG